jgi:hypothetical protein
MAAGMSHCMQEPIPCFVQRAAISFYPKVLELNKIFNYTAAFLPRCWTETSNLCRVFVGILDRGVLVLRAAAKPYKSPQERATGITFVCIGRMCFHVIKF